MTKRKALPVYLTPSNEEFLESEAHRTGLSQSGIANAAIANYAASEKRINEVNRMLEDARIEDLEKQNLGE